jgi:hypothetical protein
VRLDNSHQHPADDHHHHRDQHDRADRARERQALHPDANTGSIRHYRGGHDGPPSDTAERIAGAILAFRPGALFVFDTR